MNAAQQAKIRDIENKMADLQQELEDLRNAPVEKWEPKGGDYFISGWGTVHNGGSSDSFRPFGMEHQTRAAAEEHARDLKVFNWLWQFRQEHREAGEREDEFVVLTRTGWRAQAALRASPARIRMSARVAELAVDALTEGRLVLEGFDSNLPH